MSTINLYVYIVLSPIHSFNLFGQDQGRNMRVPGRETITTERNGLVTSLQAVTILVVLL